MRTIIPPRRASNHQMPPTRIAVAQTPSNNPPPAPRFSFQSFSAFNLMMVTHVLVQHRAFSLVPRSPPSILCPPNFLYHLKASSLCCSFLYSYIFLDSSEKCTGGSMTDSSHVRPPHRVKLPCAASPSNAETLQRAR